MLLIKLFLFSYYFISHCVYLEVVKNVRLVNHREYFTELVQATMNKVEDDGWCNLKIPDFSQNINQTIYGWHIAGTVAYRNGFMISLHSMDLENIQQLWGHNSVTEISHVVVRGTLRMHDVSLGYDIEFTPTVGETQYYTGLFTYERIDFDLSIRKTFPAHDLEASGSVIRTEAPRRWLIYLPQTNVTEVLQRNFFISDAMSGLNAWGSDVFQPILLNLATTTIQFPELCYNCNVV